MNRLIINTANKCLEIVLKKGDEYFSCVTESNIKHNEAMLPLLDDLLIKNALTVNDISELGVVIGPGSFTGIRVGIATVKAFRDVNKVIAKGINNLEYLYYLAMSQNKRVEVVAILGSIDSFFVARKVMNKLFIYERNLTLKELKEIAGDGPIAMFEECEGVNCFVIKPDARILNNCFEESKDESLVPVYYQLSQAEREEIKHSKLEIVSATEKDLMQISTLEAKYIQYNTISYESFIRYIQDDNYKIYIAKINGQIVGFILLEITDEVNISSVVVDENYRNIGLATKLIEKAKICAKEKNISTLSLEVSESNLRAYLLYEKLGFVTRRERKNYYQDSSSAFDMVLKV